MRKKYALAKLQTNLFTVTYVLFFFIIIVLLLFFLYCTQKYTKPLSAIPAVMMVVMSP